LENFEFITAKILDEDRIEYFPGKGKCLNLEIDENIVLTLVLASQKILDENFYNSSKNSDAENNIYVNDSKSSFLISKYPITQKQYYKIIGNFQVGGNLGFKKPVLVSWTDAIEFCDRLSQKEGKEYRLPYESEWEFACRAGSKYSFSSGNILRSDLANFGRNSAITDSKKISQLIMDVGMFPPNDFGIHDMHGNVWEWCQDNDPFSNNPSLRIVKGVAY
jgi:eukaryotic-like serine/threonine-protein kinase